MSVALWRDGQRLQSDWGTLEYTYADFVKDPIYVGPTILAIESYVAELLMFGPKWTRGALASIEVVGDHTFWHSDAHGQRWTWELFPAHFMPPRHTIRDFMIGRWPD